MPHRSRLPFATRFRVRYAEIDGQRVVFNSRYLEYADAAVAEFWDATGIEAALGAAWRGTEFHVRRTEIDYLKPFVYGDTVQAHVGLGRIGTTSLTQLFEFAEAGTGALHATIAMVVVNVDLATGRPTPIDPAVRAFIAGMGDGDAGAGSGCQAAGPGPI